MGTQLTIFGNCLFLPLTPYFLQKLCFADNATKMVFSAEHSFCGSQIVNNLSETRSTLCLLKPLFGNKKNAKPRFCHDGCCSRKCSFLSPFQIQIVFCYFSEKNILGKIQLFRPTQDDFIWAYLSIFYVSCCLFVLVFLQHKNATKKMRSSFRKPHFRHPLGNSLFCTPCTVFVICT